MLENTMNKPIPRAFMKGLFVALIAVLFLPSAVTADQCSVHYELNTDHYHPGDNGTLTLTYEGDMDVSVYFLSMNIVGVGIYEVTPAPPYEYKTGDKPLVVTLPFSIPVTVKPGYYQYSYEFDRGGGHPVQRGASTISIVAAGEAGPEQAGQNQNDSLPFPIIILVLLIIFVTGYLVIRRKARRNAAGKPVETGMLEQIRCWAGNLTGLVNPAASVDRHEPCVFYSHSVHAAVLHRSPAGVTDGGLPYREQEGQGG
jgi:hypothetical protein